MREFISARSMLLASAVAASSLGVFGFAEIGADVYTPAPAKSTPPAMPEDDLALLQAPRANDRVAIRYQSNSPTYDVHIVRSCPRTCLPPRKTRSS